MKRQKTLHRFAAVAAVLLTLCLVFMMPAAADATGTTVVVSDWNGLTTAFAGNNETVILGNDVSSDQSSIPKITINDGGIYTLDLNGHKMNGQFSGTGATGFIEITGGSKLTIKNGTVEAINKVIHVNGGELTLGDGITSLVLNATDGTTTDVQNQVINIYGSSDPSQTAYSVVTIKAGVTINGLTKDKTKDENKGYGIIIRENTTDTNVAYGVKLTLNGANYINADASGIWVLGNIKYAEITDEDTLSKAPTIVIENTVIHADTTAIAAMGYANWNINGGIFNAGDALNIKAGNFTITEGSFQAYGNYNVPTDANGNGTENTGSAVSILSNDGYRTEKDISVVIQNGIFLSQKGHVLYEGIGIWESDSSSHNKGDPASTDSHVKTLSISGGTFTSHVDEYDRTTVNLTSFQSKSVVTGGTFKSVRSANMVLGTEYLVSGYSLKKSTVTEGSITYHVGEVTETVVPPTEDPEDPTDDTDTSPTEIIPSIDATYSEEDKTITLSEGTTAKVFTEEDEIPIDAENIVGIYNEENPYVVLVVTEATVKDGKVTLSDKSVVLAVYPEISSAVSESKDAEEVVSVVVLIGMDTPNANSLPSFSGEFNDEVAEAVESVSDKDYKPLSMITATDKVSVINNNLANNLADMKGAIGITFRISDDLYQKYKDKFVALHVKEGKVINTIQVKAYKDEDTGKWNLEIFGDSFSSYVLAVDNTPKPVGNSGSATNTGSGNYNEYPRQADGKAGEISFGTSKTVKSVDLPAGVTGEVKLIAKSTNPGPEGKNIFHVFEINIPNYPTGKPATIKFEMTLADIEAKGLTAADVCLYHFNKETGLWEKLPTTYKVVDGKVYFESVTTGFSPFAIVFEEGAATPAAGEDKPVTPPTETPDVPNTPGTLPPADTPETPETPASPAPILAVLAGLGAVAALRRK